MLVSDVYLNLKKILGQCSEDQIFASLNLGQEVLANEGQYDPMTGYMDLSVASGYFISLPRDVETPIRININNNPAFFRNRAFEFAQNTNGTELGEQLGWQWSDRGEEVVQSEDGLPSTINALGASAADDGEIITLIGISSTTGLEVEEQITISSTSPVASTTNFAKINRVIKPVTTSTVNLRAGTDVLATYYADETEPQYKVIKLSKTASTVRMMYRRKTRKITSQDDYIPLHSQMAVIAITRYAFLMLQSKVADALPFKAEAIELINKEQASRNIQDQIAKANDLPSAINRNIGVKDAIIVGDIYDEASEICQGVGRDKLFDRITDAIEVLENKCLWDSTLGYADLLPSQFIDSEYAYSDFALPRYIDSVIQLNYNNTPGFMRNKWFEFHLNGIGKDCPRCSGWDDMGQTVTINHFEKDSDGEIITVDLVALPDSSSDNGTEIRVFGYDEDNKWIRVNDEDGFLVPCVFNTLTPNPDAPKIKKIVRIQKATSDGFIKLVTLDSDGAEDILLGYYEPDEFEPMYRRIRVPGTDKRVTMMYRKRSKKISSITDFINLKSRLAITTMLRALEAMKTDIQTGEMLEMKAVRYLKDQQAISNTGEAPSLQINSSIFSFNTCNIQ